MSQCLCDFGYREVPITNNIPNLARTCGTGSDACTVAVDSTDPAIPAAQPVYINDGSTGVNLWWRSIPNAGLHWARINFPSAYVTAVQLAVPGYVSIDGFVNSGVIVGNNANVMSSDNSLCVIIPNVNAAQKYNSGGLSIPEVYVTFTCNTPILGQFVFISNRCNQGGSCGALSIWEWKVVGYRVDSVSCGACTAGTFKDTLGSAACTNCPANTYSGLTAQRSNATCTKCYDNSVALAGSTTIDACGCSAGFEFS